MKRNISLLFIILLFLAFQPVRVAGSESRVARVAIMADSLMENLLKEPTKQELVVCLPPSYFSSQKRYPVVYYFHGYTRGPEDIIPFTSGFDAQMKAGAAEFIIVGVNGKNRLQGSFFVNSPVTGKWEDFVIKDVVTYIDSTYRTIAKAGSRGTSGWSMGGFAAINLAFKHPDIFSTVYSIGPGLFDENGLRDAYRSWDQTFIEAYGAAFSPNPEKRYPYSDRPKFNNSEADNIIRANWENGYGNLRQKIEAYQQLNTPLKAVRILYGKSDSYTWIPKGCIYFSKLLKEYNIPHELTEFSGGHEQGVLKESFVPFFSANLQTE